MGIISFEVVLVTFRAFKYFDIIEVYKIFVPFSPHHFRQFCHYKQYSQIKQVSRYIIKRSYICEVLIGGYCNKSLTARIDKSANGQYSEQPNISDNLLCICKKQIFEIIETSSIDRPTESFWGWKSWGGKLWINSCSTCVIWIYFSGCKNKALCFFWWARIKIHGFL